MARNLGSGPAPRRRLVTTYRRRLRWYPLVAPFRLGSQYLKNMMYHDFIARTESFWVEGPIRIPLGLHALFQKYGSDKGAGVEGPYLHDGEPHSYAALYETLFASKRLTVRAILEVGIGTDGPTNTMGDDYKPGASLRAWRDYFPSAQIYGGDIDRGALFRDDRIITGYLDQTDRQSVDAFVAEVGLPELDIIIDDGLHTFDAGKIALLSLWKHLRPDGGIYVIEDVSGETLRNFVGFLAGCIELQDATTSWVSFFTPGRELSDDSVILLRKHIPPPDERSIREVVR